MASLNAPDAQGTADITPVPLLEVLRFVARAKWSLLAGLMSGAVLGLAVGLLLTKQYRADVVLMVVTPTDARVGALGEQLGGLASLVGMDIGGSATRSEAVETLRSRYLASLFIKRNGLLPLFFPREWDPQARAWRSNDPSEQPTVAEGVRRFHERVLRVSEDKAADTILLSVTWPDRVAAARWADGLVALANEELRNRAIHEAKRSLDFLGEELKKTDAVEVRSVMYRMMEGHLRTMVVAKTRADYALRAIDPATVPDAKSYVTPRRVLLVLIGAVVGALVVLLWHAMAGATKAVPRSRAGPA